MDIVVAIGHKIPHAIQLSQMFVESEDMEPMECSSRTAMGELPKIKFAGRTQWGFCNIPALPNLENLKQC
jgi:hypothetical protein